MKIIRLLSESAQQTHKISTSLTKSEVTKLKKMIKTEEMSSITLSIDAGGHNSDTNSQYYVIAGTEQELKDLCDYCADSIGYFSERDIEKI